MRRAEILRKFDEIVAFAEVEEFLDTPVKHYSSGMYTRLAFAVAAHLEPEILVVDEVLAVGDQDFQKKCLRQMGQVATSGRTVLFVSHNMAAIQTLCAETIYLRSGRIAASGPTGKCVDAYVAESRARLAIGEGNRLPLGSGLYIEEFQFDPNPVEATCPGRLTLQFGCDGAIRLYAVAVLIYSALGLRVAIVDLRERGVVHEVRSTTPLRFEAQINNLPLVEGTYRVGLYLNAAEPQLTGNFLDLIDMHVTARRPKDGIAPYQPHDRGVLDLDADIASDGIVV
jgi:lipopolysaccharide transport system ATP-binding protein